MTGDKIYNKNVYRYLLKICNQRIIVDLIDMMLTDEEEERPNFKTLKYVIMRDHK